MKSALLLAALGFVLFAGTAQAYELNHAGWVAEENCDRGTSASESTWCEDYGGGSPGYRQRLALEERLAKIKASIDAIMSPKLFKAPDYD